MKSNSDSAVSLGELMDMFLAEYAGSQEANAREKESFRALLSRFQETISSDGYSREKLTSFLDGTNYHLVEAFVDFLKNRGCFERLPGDIKNRFSFARDYVASRPVTARDYDEHVMLQGMKRQIDDHYVPKDNSRIRRLELIMNFLSPSPGEKILDAGCGTGGLAHHCARRGAEVWGIDYSEKSIEMASLLSKQFGTSSGTHFLSGDAAVKISFPDDFFDKAFAVDFVEHTDDLQKKRFLTELKRVLKPGGTAVVFTPNRLREVLGNVKYHVEYWLGLSKVFQCDRMHFGLTDKFRYEKLLRQSGFTFRLFHRDIVRPYLSYIPALRIILSLNLIWVIRKKTS